MWREESHKSDTKMDLSLAAAKKAALRTTYDNMLTLGSLGVGILSGTWVAVIEPSLLAGIVCAIGFITGLSNAAIHLFFLQDKHATGYIQKALKQLEQQREEKIEKLENSFRSPYSGVQSFKEVNQQQNFQEIRCQGIRQCEQVQIRLKKIKDLLREKLSTGELVFGRFSGTTEQVSLAVLDNLQTVLYLLKSLPDDQLEIEGDIKKLERKKRSQEEENRLTIFTERRKVYEAQLGKISALLAQNEVAITELDKATFALAEMDTNKQAEMDLETARKCLEELVDRTKKLHEEVVDPLQGRI